MEKEEKEEEFKQILDLNILPTLNKWRLVEKRCDVVLVAHGRQIPAHKCVLAAASEYFETMFYGSFSESCVSQKEVNLSEVVEDSETLEYLIESLYLGEIVINSSNVQPLTQLSSFLLINNIKTVCETYLLQNVPITLSDCLHWLAIGLDYHLENVLARVKKLIRCRFSDYLVHEECDSLIAMTCGQLNYIFLDLNFPEMQDVAIAFYLRWYLHDPTEERLKTAAACLSYEYNFDVQITKVMTEIKGHIQAENDVDKQKLLNLFYKLCSEYESVVSDEEMDNKTILSASPLNEKETNSFQPCEKDGTKTYKQTQEVEDDATAMPNNCKENSPKDKNSSHDLKQNTVSQKSPGIEGKIVSADICLGINGSKNKVGNHAENQHDLNQSLDTLQGADGKNSLNLQEKFGGEENFSLGDRKAEEENLNQNKSYESEDKEKLLKDSELHQERETMDDCIDNLCKTYDVMFFLVPSKEFVKHKCLEIKHFGNSKSRSFTDTLFSDFDGEKGDNLYWKIKESENKDHGLHVLAFLDNDFDCEVVDDGEEKSLYSHVWYELGYIHVKDVPEMLLRVNEKAVKRTAYLDNRIIVCSASNHRVMYSLDLNMMSWTEISCDAFRRNINPPPEEDYWFASGIDVDCVIPVVVDRNLFAVVKKSKKRFGFCYETDDFFEGRKIGEEEYSIECYKLCGGLEQGTWVLWCASELSTLAVRGPIQVTACKSRTENAIFAICLEREQIEQDAEDVLSLHRILKFNLTSQDCSKVSCHTDIDLLNTLHCLDGHEEDDLQWLVDSDRKIVGKCGGKKSYECGSDFLEEFFTADTSEAKKALWASPCCPYLEITSGGHLYRFRGHENDLRLLCKKPKYSDDIQKFRPLENYTSFERLSVYDFNQVARVSGCNLQSPPFKFCTLAASGKFRAKDIKENHFFEKFKPSTRYLHK